MLRPILALLVASLQHVHMPTDSMPVDQQMASASISADYFVLRRDADVLAEATELVNGEELTHADGSPPYVSSGQELSVMGVTAGDGRMVVVLFDYGDEHTAPAMCRIRAGLNGSSPATYRARRWCAERLGVQLPQTTPSPIGNN